MIFPADLVGPVIQIYTCPGKLSLALPIKKNTYVIYTNMLLWENMIYFYIYIIYFKKQPYLLKLISHLTFNFIIYDDTVMYCSASPGQQALYKLQSAFDVFQSRLYRLKLVLNADKTKYMLFSGIFGFSSDLTR